MWRSKKFIIVTVLAAVLLVGSIGGVALAQTGNGDDSQPKAPHEALFARVCEILVGNGINITAEQLEDAFTQARNEMRSEALDQYLQKRVEQGEITQEQADQYKAWRQAKPDFPMKFGFKGHGGFRGMGGMHRFGGPCAPTE